MEVFPDNYLQKNFNDKITNKKMKSLILNARKRIIMSLNGELKRVQSFPTAPAICSSNSFLLKYTRGRKGLENIKISGVSSFLVNLSYRL